MELAFAYGVPSCLRFEMPGFHVWDGSITQDPDGGYSLFFSRWPLKEGHEGWIDFSEICRARGPSPWGPYEFDRVVMTREDTSAWDAHNYHNGTVKKFRGKYYIYYTGNRGDGDWWNHRNNQRIGVAFSDSLSGEWNRFRRPLLDVSPLSWDDLCVANPSVTEKIEGGYLMMYKGVTDGPRPFGSRVLHGMAYSADPNGPFEKIATSLFEMPGETFPFEDPYLWRDGNSYRCLMKDMKGRLAPTPCAVLEFTSHDGITWDPLCNRLVALPYLIHSDHSVEHVERLERPSYFPDPVRPCLSFAVKPHGGAESFLVFKPGTLLK